MKIKKTKYNLSNLFKTYERCAFCNSKNKKIETNKKFKDNFYLKAIRNDLNISLNFLKKIRVYKCLNCGIIQNNPWFKEEISRKIYSNIYGQHNRGWSNLINFFDNGKLPSHGDLFEILIQKLNIKSYAEFNSPFMGLFINFFSKEFFGNKFEKRKLFNYCINYLNSRQVAAMSKKKLERSEKISKKFCNQIKKLKNKNYYSNKIIKSLFVDNSSLSWGQNDNYKSVNSKSLASELFDLKIYELQERDAKKFKFDLFGIFHTLDHTFQPKKVLNFALNSSKFVIVYCHVDEQLEKQHLFSITNSFLKYLSRNKIYYIDLTHKINKNFKTKELYFICTKTKKNLEILNKK